MPNSTNLRRVIFAQEGSGVDAIDLDAIVERQWQLLDMDAVIDSAVDDAVAVLKRDDDLWNTFLSGWSPAKAEDLAQDCGRGRIRLRDLPAGAG